MILTDYYQMSKLPGQKSKTRFDCIKSTGEYEPFEERGQRAREKHFKCYLTKTPSTFKSGFKRTADLVISDSTNISSVYIPDLENQHIAYGDVANTDDALLLLFSEDFQNVEIFVARGEKRNQFQLYNRLVDDTLGDDIERLRKEAKPTNVVLS